MGLYFARHAQACIASLGKLWRQPVGTALTVLVIGIALALPAGLGVVVRNGEAVAGHWDSVRDFSVYLRPGTQSAVAEALRDDLKKRSGIDEVRLVTADSALEGFRDRSGFGEILDVMEENPLPHTLIVRPDAETPAEALAAIAEELSSHADVDLVQLDTQWLARLKAILDVTRRGIWIAAILLLGAVIVIVGNTIRLDIQNQRAEIEVAKLLGAADGFVRRPFLYTGFWYGLAGGLLALLVVLLAQALLSGPVDRLIGLYGGGFEPVGLGRDGVLAVLAGGLLAGLAGAWIAVARHLAKIEPKV